MLWQNENLFPAQYQDSDSESLQTDILRFMAIIGFCLMAVFALIQAIPVTNPAEERVIEDLSRDAGLLEAKLVHLRAENGRLLRELNRLMLYEVIAKSGIKELEQVREDLLQQKEEIDRLTGEKIEQQQDLMHYKVRLSKRDDKISALEAEKDRVQQIVEKAIKKTNTLPEPEKVPAPEPKDAPKEKGLYVAFESDRLFLDLLGAGKISLFINVTGMKQGFQVVEKDGMIDFTSRAPAKDLDLWEVQENMVPSEIIEAFKSWTTLSSREKMLIVGLTPEISRQIRGRKVSGGRFIIKEGGRVDYSPEGD